MSLTNYQILAFEAISPKGLITLRENGRYLLEGSDACGSTLEMELKWYRQGITGPIHSVKRLNDGKIFTVGEWVELTGTVINGVIEKFSLSSYDEICFHYFGCELRYHLDNINHVRSIKSPPIGLKPRDISERQYGKGRIKEILEAMYRYNEAQKQFPIEWTSELADLINNL